MKKLESTNWQLRRLIFKYLNQVHVVVRCCDKDHICQFFATLEILSN